MIFLHQFFWYVHVHNSVVNFTTNGDVFILKKITLKHHFDTFIVVRLLNKLDKYIITEV